MAVAAAGVRRGDAAARDVAGLGVAFPLALLVGFSSMWFMTASTAIVQLRADPVMRGRVLALQAIVLIGSTPIGGPLLGYVSDLFGARAGLVLGGLAALAAAAWGTMAARRVHRATLPNDAVATAEGVTLAATREDAEV